MGTPCCKPSPTVEAEVSGNDCCDSDTCLCRSKCCIIQVIKAGSSKSLNLPGKGPPPHSTID